MNVKYDETLDQLYHKKLKDFYNKKSIIIPKLNHKMDELERKRTEENTEIISQNIHMIQRKKAVSYTHLTLPTKA